MGYHSFGFRYFFFSPLFCWMFQKKKKESPLVSFVPFYFSFFLFFFFFFFFFFFLFFPFSFEVLLLRAVYISMVCLCDVLHRCGTKKKKTTKQTKYTLQSVF